MKYARKNKGKWKPSSKRYALQRSGFFRLERRVDLAAMLRTTVSDLDDLIIQREDLYNVRDELIGNKVRNLQVPVGDMRRIHEKILGLLRRIKLPKYIRSPRNGSTAWSNAAIHQNSPVITTFDVKDFYPSTSEEHVFQFFKHRLEMSDDCARIMAQICTFRGFVPQGSPVSPHLACLTHLDLFQGVEQSCAETDSKISVWVDDIVVSGPALRRDITNAIKRRARQKGLLVHKERRGGGQRGIELTGSFIRNGKLSVANSSHLKVKALSDELGATVDPALRFALLNRLISMARYQRTVLKSSGGNIERLNSRIQYYKREMNKLSAVLSVTEPVATASEVGMSPDPNVDIF